MHPGTSEKKKKGIQRLKALVGYSKYKIGKILGMSEATVRKFWDWEPPGFPKTDDKTTEDKEEPKEAYDDNNNLTYNLRNYILNNHL